MSVMLPKAVERGFLFVINPAIHLFTRSRVNPNWFTTLGFLLNVVGAGCFAWGARFGTREDLAFIGWGGFWVLMGGICDILDGKVARGSGQATRFGALFDSVLDRYSEVVMFLGMGYYLIAHDYFNESVFCFIALGGSTMVSYIRARSEALQLDCKVGLMQRAERIVWLGAGSLFCGLSVYLMDPKFVYMFGDIPLFKPIYLFTVPLAVVAVLANFTAVQRMQHTYRLSRNGTQGDSH